MPENPHAKAAYEEWREARLRGDPEEAKLFDRFARSWINPITRVQEYILGITKHFVSKQSVGYRLDAQEIAGHVLEELWRRAPVIRHLKSFLYSMIWHRVLDEMRRIKNDRFESVPEEVLALLGCEVLPSEEDGELDDTAEALRLKIAVALDQLSPAQRYVLIRVDMDGASLSDVAAELGQILNTVVKRHTRAQAKLRGLLGG